MRRPLVLKTRPSQDTGEVTSLEQLLSAIQLPG